MTNVKRRPLVNRAPWSYHVTIATLRPVLMGITRRDWAGGEHLPPSGGFIVAANHYSEFDPLPLAHFLVDHGHVPFFLAKSTLFSVPGLGAALRSLEQVPVYRATSRAADGLDAAKSALVDEGKCIVIMPEGTLTHDPELWPMKAKTGVARLALATQVPVIPVASWGAHDMLAPYARRPGNLLKRPVQHVLAGEAVDLTDLYDRPLDPKAHQAATTRIMRHISGLLGEIRGEEPPETPVDPVTTPSLNPRKRGAGQGKGS